jgi:hypothetical protein
MRCASVILIAGALLGAACAPGVPPAATSTPAGLAAPTVAPTRAPATPRPAVRTDLTGAPVPPVQVISRDFDEARFNRGIGRFPPLNHPESVPAAAATWLDDNDLILGALHNGEARAYPVFMMTLHHVATDRLGGDPYLVTW